jgi:hypothetical protein
MEGVKLVVVVKQLLLREVGCVDELVRVELLCFFELAKLNLTNR